jgi:hypothetical protein
MTKRSPSNGVTAQLDKETQVNLRRTQWLPTTIGMMILGARQAGHVSFYLLDSSAHGRNDRLSMIL